MIITNLLVQLWQHHLTLKYKINQIHYTLYLVVSTISSNTYILRYYS